jgi:tetratricopeptide (TPR) repeat protein
MPRKDYAMSLVDARDIPVSTSNTRSLEGAEAALELFHGYYGDPLAAVDKVLVEDPAFVFGHVLRANMLVLASDKCVLPMLRASVLAAEALHGTANDRERRHIAAARAWLDGDFSKSVSSYGDILVDYPRDILALQVAHIGDFLLGHSTLLRDRVEQVLPDWNAQVPGFSYVLGMHAFGLEETAMYERAEEEGRRALDLNSRDPWAIHAVAHVMEMQGRQEDGIAWLESRQQDWAPDNMLAIHNWWHLALLHLDMDQVDRVLALYDSHIRGGSSNLSLDLIDAAALLWRLYLGGVDTGARWHELAGVCAARNADGYYAFNDVHTMMAYLGAQNYPAAETLLRTLEAAADGRGTNAELTRDVGLPVARALMSFAFGDYGECVKLLQETRPIAHRFGGSHAQRDVFDLTLIEAALRGDQGDLAKTLAAERLSLKPTGSVNQRLAQRAGV